MTSKLISKKKWGGRSGERGERGVWEKGGRRGKEGERERERREERRGEKGKGERRGKGGGSVAKKNQ